MISFTVRSFSTNARRISTELREFAYSNKPLPIGSGQTISQHLIRAIRRGEDEFAYFVTMAKIELDFDELSQQAKAVDEQLGQLLARVKERFEDVALVEEEDSFNAEPANEGRISAEKEQLLERLFHEAEQDRTKAYELKSQLDRLDVFQDYEDRFLDLFKASED